jgi:hypothetical protein
MSPGRQSEFGRDAMSAAKADPRASESSDGSSGGPGNNQKMDVKMFIKYVHKGAVCSLVCVLCLGFSYCVVNGVVCGVQFGSQSRCK